MKQKLFVMDDHITKIFDRAIIEIMHIVIESKKKSYLLSQAGEAEAISLAINIKTRLHNTRHNLHNYALTVFDGDLHKRMILYFSHLNRVILSCIEYSLYMEEDVDKAVGKIFLKLPKRKPIPARHYLKKVKPLEADKPKSQYLNFNPALIDQETWESIVSDYKKDYIPINRSPEELFDITNPYNDEPIKQYIGTKESLWGWEVERDVNHEFVKSVREGQKEAANQNGFDEFVNIAILDDKTCDSCCGEFGCVDFDGKLSSEVEEMTKGEFSVAPFHFNCRCVIAPVTKDIVAYDISQTEKDFDEWLNS